jgi:hypothetical protein
MVSRKGHGRQAAHPEYYIRKTSTAAVPAIEFCGVEYQATMESCPDKFHVDIPNVAGARPCCTYGNHILRLHVLSSDRSDRLACPSENKN